MDDFAVDLDKVLDDFELSEGGTSGTRPDPKLNHGHNLPGLQAPVSGGGLYNTSQGAPLQPVYTQNNANNPNYRQHPTFNTQFDMNYQPQPGDYTFSQTHNSVIRATVQSDARGDVFPTSKAAVLNNQLDLTCNTDSLSQTNLPHIEPQHNDASHNPQWSTLVNNNMTPYAVKYGTEGGVLAHGERSNSNIVRRLSDDRPELLQSMEEKPTSLSQYPGEINTNQGYPGGSGVSHVRPDVVPVSLSNGHDIRHSQPTSMEFQNDSGVEHTYPKDQLNLNLAQDSSTPSLSNGDLRLSLSQPEKPMNLHLNNTAISTALESYRVNAPEDMNVDSPPHSLQSDQSNSSLDRTTDTVAITPTSVGADPADRQTSSPMCLVSSNNVNDNDQSEMLPEDAPDSSNSTIPQEEPASTPRLPAHNIQSVEPVAVGFGDIQVDDITEDDMDAYLATVEAPGSEQAPIASTDPQSSCPSSLPLSSSIPPPSGLASGDEPHSFSRSDSQGSGGIVERFLAPSLASPRIATPMDDPGFSKVPGYVPSIDMASLQEVPTLREDKEEEETEGEQQGMCDSTVGQGHQEQPPVYTSISQSSTPMSDSGQPNKEERPAEPVVTDSHVPAETTSPQIGGDCVMTMDKQKGDHVQTTSALGAITVSFPMQGQAQPMDTTASLPDAGSDASCNHAGSGARPKETTTQNTQRKSRPNSLLGLSKPDLNITVPVSGYGDMVTGTGSIPAAAAGGCLDHAESLATGSTVENSHDIINRQLAQKSRSPLQKKQLNLEIKQHIDNAAAQRQFETKTLDNRTEDDAGLVSVVTNRAQLASGIGLTLPYEGNPMSRTDSGFQEDIMSSSSSSSLLSLQAPSPLRVINNLHTAMEPNTEDWQQQQQYQQQQQEQHQQQQQHQQQEQGEQEDLKEDDYSCAEDDPEGQGGKLKRPTSLSLMPRNEFQLGQDKDSTEDDSITGGDAGYASSGSSSGHLTPFQGENEMSEPAGATASGPGAELYSPPEVGPGAFSPAPRCSSNANVEITQLGKVAPRWVPDAEACNCMECEARFTFTKRRHHCRACGKVFCSACCNLKCKLQYMDNKEARVCSKCYQDIVRAQAYERMHSPNRSPNPNNPAEYCSTIPPLQQAAASLHAPPPTVMVPVGVLRKEGSQRSREPKQVMFSDGIRPGGDLTELDGSDARISIRRTRSSKKVERMAAAAAAAAENSSEAKTKSPSPKTRVKRLSEPSLRHACLIPDTGLPPVIMSTGVKGDFTLEEDPNPETILPKIRSTEDPNPVVFAINKNLFVLVKIVNLDCCLNRVCWCFSTKGMCTVGQDEVVIVLECLPDEKTIPRDIFCHLNSVYDEASKGNTVSHLGHTIFGQSFLDSRDHCGFLYIRPTFQCVQKLLLPQPPYVFGLLLQRWETPWAKVFPVRLMLRLGAEYRYYPCPLISVRFRKPVYGEIGHTIMNLLADFRNYQYMLPQTRGVVVHMEEKKTFINFPRNRYEEVMKVITNSNDHVMALGANFSTDADSHLVCIQNEDGNYQTQAINIQNKPRKVTGASFVVFNGALKTSSGLRAKSSIVEDGLMVQITSESMAKLKAALLDMKDYTISCGSLDVPVPEEQVIIQWVEDDHKVNQGVKSPVDGLPMDGVESIHIHNGTDYVGETRTIRWTEVFFIQNEDSSNSRGEPVDLSRLAETLAQACCIALTPHLDKLRESGLNKLGLRCTIDRDNVGYEIGSNGEKLPDNYMNDLDNELIPVIHNAGSQSQDGPVVLELIFYIIE